MTNLEAIKETLKSDGDIIVAIPKSDCAPAAKTLADAFSMRGTIETSVIPIIAHGFVYGNKRKFNVKEYSENFFDKCWTLGDNISIISL